MGRFDFIVETRERLERAACAWSCRTQGCEQGLRKRTDSEKADEGEKEVRMSRESRFEERKEGGKENEQRSELSQRRETFGKEAVC